MNKFYITQPSTNIDNKPYETAEKAMVAADIKIEHGCQTIAIYECNLTHILKRGETIIEKI